MTPALRNGPVTPVDCSCDPDVRLAVNPPEQPFGDAQPLHDAIEWLGAIGAVCFAIGFVLALLRGVFFVFTGN